MEDKRDLIINEQMPACTGQQPAYSTSPPPNFQAYSTANMYHHESQHKPGCPPHAAILIRHSQAPPRDFMVMAILVTIFCCLPFGIVGIIKAYKAKNMYAFGNYQGAEMASQSAGKWSRVGLIFGANCIIYIVIYIAVILSVDWDDDLITFGVVCIILFTMLMVIWILDSCNQGCK